MKDPPIAFVALLALCLAIAGCGGGKVTGPEDVLADGRHSPGIPCAASDAHGMNWALHSACEK